MRLCIPIFVATLAGAGYSVDTSDAEWAAFGQQVEGRLFKGAPFASPCFTNFAGEGCDSVAAGYLDELTRSNASGAYINTQWETCQVTGQQCLLDFTNPHNKAPTAPPMKCEMGSVSSYFVDVRTPNDVVAAFQLSKRTGVPVVVKNTGHDYKGRSSAPNSLALWTHNLKNISYDPDFTPEGCAHASSAVTVAAGVQWGEAYTFAEAHNITLIGGSDAAVGVSGGWLQGGGHGVLSNTHGMGVDNVLQFKVVTPDGQFRVVNACQNEDLFFALRGGGGGTFGVVLESTHVAYPRVTLQAVIIAFAPNSTRTQTLWSIMVDNGIQWAKDGWGGLSNSGTVVYLNPNMSAGEAARSMAPLIQFGKELEKEGVQGAITVTTFPSFGAFFAAFVSEHVAVVGVSLALASRLINKSNFETSSSRSALLSALLSANAATPGLIILMGPPTSFPGDGKTSVTEQWRNSIYHVTVVSPWNWNATKAEKKAGYDAASRSIDHLRDITVDAAYLNEADVYEPNHETAFWGHNYPALLSVKRKYDPEHLLDCWQCVGWNPKSPRFSCYL